MWYGSGINIGLFGIIFTIVFWALIVWLIITIIAWLGRSSPNYYKNHHDIRDRRNNVIDILEERYAKGEINKEEFDQKKKDLMTK